jgi:hypothetical protein
LGELQECLERSEVIEERMDVTKEHLRRIEHEYGEVSKKTSELYTLCEGLMSEERHLKMFGEEMRESLKYWEMLEKLSHQLHSPSLTAENEHFGEMLKNIEEGIDYFERNPRIREGEVYRMKFKQLQSRALFLVKNYVIAFFKHIESIQHNITLPSSSDTTASHIHAKAENASQTQNPHSLSSFAELEQNISIKNAQFKQISPKIRHLVHQIESRASVREYSLLLNDIINAYFLLRRNTLQNYIQMQIHQIVKDHDVFTMVREGMLLFIRLCEDEFQHCRSIFHSTLVVSSLQGKGAEKVTSEGPNQISSNLTPRSPSTPPLTLIQLRNWLESFFSLLNDHLRPIIIRSKDINLLCSLIDILQYETMDSFIDKNSNELEALRPIVMRLLEDIRERLIFVSGIFIHDEIADFVPSEADLNYPSLLEEANKREEGKKGENGIETENSNLGVVSQSSESNGIENDGSHDDVSYEMEVKRRGWYPTLEKTIQMLARLYVAIDGQSFSSIAQDAVMTCFQTLCSASKKIEAKSGKEDAQLFLIKYLNILQDTIIPFEIDFFVKETNLDFGHTRDLLRRIFSGEVSLSSLFALSSNNALYAIFQSAAPRITHSERDVSQAMQDILKSTIEAYIYSATNLATLKILPFLYQARLFIKSQMEANQTGSSDFNQNSSKFGQNLDSSKNSSKNGQNLQNNPLDSRPSSDPTTTTTTNHHHDAILLSSLAKQPFASPETVKALLLETVSHVEMAIPLIMSKLRIYLGFDQNGALSPSSSFPTSSSGHVNTQGSHQSSIIFRSISDNIVETFENVASLLMVNETSSHSTTATTASSSTSVAQSNPYSEECLKPLKAELSSSALRSLLISSYHGNATVWKNL